MKQPKVGIVLSKGITLIEHVYQALSKVCKNIVLVGKCQEIPESLKDLKRIEDNYDNCGPLGGLEALLSSNLDTEYLIVPCDLFKVTPELLKFLASQERKLPIVLKSKSGLEPLTGRYPSSLLSLVEKQIKSGELAMHDLASKAGATIIPVPKEYEGALHNANTSEDLKGG